MKKLLLKNDNYIIIPFWVLLFFMFWLQVMPQTESIIESLLFSLLLLISIYYPTTYLSQNLLIKAMKKKRTRKFIIQLLLISLIVGFIFAILLYLFNYLEQKGIFPPSDYFDMADTPLYFILILFSSGVFINICLCGLHFLLEYIKSQKTILEYQLKNLQHQVSPHFMFNVLNHIHILMQKNVDLAADLLVKYSDILRYQLYTGNEKSVPLKQEIQFLKDVIEVEKMRWGNELKVNCNWQIEDQERQIHPLLLITFVENAFKHVARSMTDKGYINITLSQKKNVLYMEVENSKPSQQIEKKKASGLGLSNIKERLEILYSDKHTLQINESEKDYIIQLEITL